jgi:hypothetical protein
VLRRPIATLCAAIGAFAVVATAAAAGIDDGATGASVAERVDPPTPALLVSDSAWLGIKTYGAVDAVQGAAVMLDLASCRRRVTTSCTNYDGHVPITLLAELDWREDTYDTLIVATGYNDSDHDFRSDLDTIMARAGELGYRRVVWLTLREDVSYMSPGDAGFAAVFRNNNRALRELEAAGTYPQLVVADWAAYARAQDQWFANDGIHLRLEGPWAAADYISRTLAFLDGRPCPEPARSGAAVPDPCPDPDAAPPDVDLRSLYPIGQPGNPTQGFEMEWAGSSSWPSPPWWDR